MPIGGERVTLRAATPGDAPAIADVWWRGWRDGHLGNVPDTLVRDRTEASFGVRASRRTADTVVAIVDGAVAGFVMVVDDEVEQVYVAAAHRGGGVAAMLLDEASAASRSGHERAWLAVVPGNARARRFYERQGWRDDGLFEHAAAGSREPIPVPAHRYVKRVAAARDATP